MTIDVKYKNNKRYNTARYPIRQPKIIMALIWILSKIMLADKKYKVEKVGMEGLKPPYMLLSNHMHFIDFELTAMATYPYPVSNVVSIDGYVIKWFLLEWIGAIATRKFTTDVHLVKSIRKVLQRGDILAMYPEARYTPCGTTSYLPESLGKLVKMNKVPVVTIVHHGNYLHSPFWNFRKKFDFSLKRTRKWWNIIINAAVSDGYRIISNKGAYAIIRDNKIIEFAYISDYFRDSLIIGDAVLTLPPVMYFGEYKYNDCYVAMMLDWE